MLNQNKFNQNRNLLFNFLNLKSCIGLIICLLIASTFIYFSFFACFFLLVAGVCTALSQKKWIPLLNAGILIGIIVLGIFAYNFPSFLYQHDNGKNLQSAIRSPTESEIYGLKIIQLLLPIPQHRIGFFSKITQLYMNSSPVINENFMSALGLVGSIGFILLIGVLFFTLPSSSKIHPLINRLSQLSILNIFAILFCTIGGFGEIFAFTVTSQIRALNRVSIFIAFFSLLAVLIVFEYIYDVYLNKKNLRWIYYLLILLVLFIGIFDQTSEQFIPPYQSIKNEYLNDKNFIEKIEANTPNDTMIFQLPYVPFPENPPVNQMADYDHFRAYLHSVNIRWSYGAMKGRNGDLWQKEIVSKPPTEMVDGLSFAGFNGIYVDSYGYADNGKDVISSLTSILQTTPLVSDNGRLYFFDMTQYNIQLKSQYTSDEFEKHKDQILYPIGVYWQGGFSGFEGSTENNWRWCSSQGTLVLDNPSDKERTFILNVSFSTGYPELSNLKIKSDLFSENLKINSTTVFFSKKIIVSPGRYEITFTSDAKRVDALLDPRFLVFRVWNFNIKELE